MAWTNTIVMGAAAVFLSGCFMGTSVLTSKIYFENDAQADEYSQLIKSEIVKFTSVQDGLCSTETTDGIGCRLRSNSRDASDNVLSSGIDDDGHAFILIRTTTTAFLPATEKSVRAGRHISDYHKSVEAWAVETFPDLQPQTRTRSYSGYGVIGSF